MNAQTTTYQRFIFRASEESYGPVVIRGRQKDLAVYLVSPDGSTRRLQGSEHYFENKMIYLTIEWLDADGREYTPDYTHLVVMRETPLEQTASFVNGRFLDVRKVEGALDDLSMQIQDVAGNAHGSVRVPVAEYGEGLTIPAKGDRAGSLLGFDDDGNFTTPYSISGFREDVESVLATGALINGKVAVVEQKATEATEAAREADRQAGIAETKANEATEARDSVVNAASEAISQISTDKGAALSSISTAKSGALADIGEYRRQALHEAGEAWSQTMTDISGAKADAISEIGAKAEASVAEELASQKAPVIAEITAEGEAQMEAVRAEGTTQTGLVSEMGTTQVEAVRNVYRNDLEAVTDVVDGFSGRTGTLEGKVKDLEFANKDLQAALENLREKDKSQNREIALQALRVRNLEAAAEGKLYLEEDVTYPSVAYGDGGIPGNALPKAIVYSVEGRTERSVNLVNGWVPGTLVTSNGTIYPNDSRETTEFIFLKAGPYVASRTHDNYWKAVSYNIDKSYRREMWNNQWGQFNFVMESDGYIRIGLDYLNDETNHLMLNRGTEPLPYVPYYEGLRSTSLAGVKVEGRNLWDEQTVKALIDPSNGNFSYGANYLCSENYIEVDPSKTYYLSAPVYDWMFFYDASKAWISSEARHDGRTFTVPSNCRYIKVMFPDYAGEYAHDICINESDTEDGSYTPYISKTYGFPLQLRQWETWEDGVVTSNCGELTLDGTEEWSLDGSLGSDRRFGVYMGTDHPWAGDSNVLCDIANYEATNSAPFGSFYLSNFLVFCDRDGYIASLDDWKAYLRGRSASGNPVVILYKTATATTTEKPLADVIEAEPGGKVSLVQENEPGLKNNFSITYCIKTGGTV